MSPIWAANRLNLLFDVAMSGCLGMDADPGKMSEEEKKITCRAVKNIQGKTAEHSAGRRALPPTLPL